MDYIYDIILNFNKNLYEFFEWKSNDNVINVRKIPVLKVDNDIYLDLRKNNVQVSEETLNSLKKSFSLYNERIEGNVICLITNGTSAFGVMFNNLGWLIKRSSMLFDEENEVISEFENINKVKFDFVVNEKKKLTNISRIVEEKKEYVKEFLSSVENNATLKYIYYDYYEKEAKDINIKEVLLKEINNPWNNKLNKLYELTKLLSSVK